MCTPPTLLVPTLQLRQQQVFSRGAVGRGLWSPRSRAWELVPNSFLPTQGPSLSGGSGSALLPHSCSEPGRPPRALTSPGFLGPGNPESSILKTTQLKLPPHTRERTEPRERGPELPRTSRNGKVHT